MGRALCCDKSIVKRGPWSPEEDAELKCYIETHGTGGNWIALPHKIGLRRCGKSCRLRWLNYLRPNIKHGGFTEDEDNLICTLYISIGSRWSIIASQLPGRTDNDIKNYWNTRLKKKLLSIHRRNMNTCLSQPPATPLLNKGFSSLVEPYKYWDHHLQFLNPLHTMPSPMDSYSFHQPDNLGCLGSSGDARLSNYMVPGPQHRPPDNEWSWSSNGMEGRELSYLPSGIAREV